jgi:TATA-box binding protein (TBP) (component of TFIID and TFIIIB)
MEFDKKYNDVIICKDDAIGREQPLNLIHQKVYMDADEELGLLELESQNVVFIVSYPPNKEIRGMQLLASTSTLSPFPDLGTRTWEGTLLTYGSGRVVCTGHKTVHEAIMNINALGRTLSTELNQPLNVIKGELTNMVVSGRLSFKICREKLRQQPGAKFTTKFDGTMFDALREEGKKIRVSVFQSGRFNVPGLTRIDEAKLAFIQSYRVMKNSEIDQTVQGSSRSCRNTTRKRRRIREW